MKYLITIFIIFTLTIKPVLPMVNFVINYDYVVENLCEKRDQPENSCHGKCFLAKELSKTQNNNTQNAGKILSIDNFIAQDIFSVSNYQSYITKNRSAILNVDFFHTKYPSSVFRPPLI